MMMKRMICSVTLGCAALALTPMHAKAQASDDDKKFLANAAQADANEIALSNVAVQKATNPAVKKFAETMVAQHDQIEASMKPFVEAWGITPPTGPDADHQEDINKLNSLSGNDFDKQYMDYMMADHTKAYSAFSTEVKDTKDAKFKAVVIKDKAIVAAHKNMAYSLKKKLS